MQRVMVWFFWGAALMSPADAAERMDFDELWNYAEPAETGERFRELLPAAQERGDADYLAQLLTQIARTEGLQQHFDAAHEILDEVGPMLTDEIPVARVRYLLERGRTFNSSQRQDEARPLFEAAWNLARGIGADFYAVDAAHMLEIVASGEEKLTWNQAATEAAEASESLLARRWLSSLYNNCGWTLHELGRYEEALEVFEKRLGYLQAHDPREGEISIARWSIAKTLRLLGRPADALAIQEELLRETTGDGYIFEELGECLLALGRADEAGPHFARAYEILKRDVWLQRDEAERLARLERLGTGGAE